MSVENVTELTKLTPSDPNNSCGSNFKKKWASLKFVKARIFIVAASWGFLTATERAIILPTLWLYFIKSFSYSAAMNYYAVTLAAFNLAALIVSPFYGYCAFTGVRVKVLMVLSNQLEIVGNIIYFLATAPWLVFFGRFISGLGSGSEVPMFADIVRVTTLEERTPYLAMLMLARQLGLIIGPACSILIHPLHFKIGLFHFDVYNGPGLFMAILWAVHTMVTLAVYPSIDKDGRVCQAKPLSDDKDICLTRETGSTSNSDCDDPEQTGCSKAFKWRNFDAYLKYESVALLLIIFGSYFSVLVLESMLPPITARYFDWTDLENSYGYIGGGTLVILVFFILKKLSYIYADRKLIFGGCLVLLFTYTFFLVIMIFIDSKRKILFIVLMWTGLSFHIIGVPFCLCSESFLTKQLSDADSNHVQTVLRTTITLAILAGPFVGGSLQLYPYVAIALMLCLLLVPFFMLVFRFEAFKF